LTERHSRSKKAFCSDVLFFVAADAYSQSLCEFFRAANANAFFITEPNKDNKDSIIQQLFRAAESRTAVCLTQFFRLL